MTVTSAVGETVVPVARTLNVKVLPVMSDVAAVSVILDVPPADVTIVGVNEAVSPAGRLIAVRVALSAMPDTLVSVTVAVAIPPNGTFTGAGDTATLKSFTTASCAER